MNVLVGEVVNDAMEAILLDVADGTAVLVSVLVAVPVTVLVAVPVLVAVTTMGVSDEMILVLVAVAAVASAWAVKTIMVGICATSIVGIDTGILIPVAEQASVRSTTNRKKILIRFMNYKYAKRHLRATFFSCWICALGWRSAKYSPEVFSITDYLSGCQMPSITAKTMPRL